MQPVQAQILLILDDKAAATRMQRLLEELGHCVQCSHSSEEGLQLITQHRYDAALVGHSPPRQDGLALVAEIMTRKEAASGPYSLPASIVIAGTGVSPAGHVKSAVQAIKAGAADYLVAESADLSDCLIHSIAEAVRRQPPAPGGDLFTPDRESPCPAGGNAAEGRQDPASKQILSPRENECLRWSASGNNTASIAYALGVSERTVRFHISNAMSKLEATSRTHAIARAMQLGLLHL